MSANDSALENWIAQSLKRPHINNQDKETATRPAENKLSDTDRMIAVIEAAATTFDANDPRAVETLFAGQAVALDVIFKDFIRRRAQGAGAMPFDVQDPRRLQDAPAARREKFERADY
jgi:hypothetical protein